MTLHIGHMTLTNLLYSSTWMLFALFFLNWGDIEANTFSNCSIDRFCLVEYARLLYVFCSLLEEKLCLLRPVVCFELIF